MNRAASVLSNSFKLQRLLRRRTTDPVDGTTAMQWFLLGIIAVDRNPSVSRIASEMGITLPSATIAIDRLVSQGLVERQADLQDRRVSRVTMTELGLQELAVAKQTKLTQVKAVLDHLSPADQAHLERIIRTLVDQISREHNQDMQP